jgi:hypothetical protein
MLEDQVRIDQVRDDRALLRLVTEITRLSDEVDRGRIHVALLEDGLRRARLELTQLLGDEKLGAENAETIEATLKRELMRTHTSPAESTRRREV